MASSWRKLGFVAMLLCLSCSMLIRGQDLSKHLVIENGSKLGFTGGPLAIKLAENSSGGGSTEDSHIVYNSGYRSKGRHGGTLWHGVRAEITVWNILDVQPLSSSGAYIAVINKGAGLEFIAAGIHVNPSLYNDNKVHFFTYWTSTSDYSTGCYNKDCPGFVPADGSNLYPGEPFHPPFSTYEGEQRGITIRIKKDEHTGDWSLYREDLGGPTNGMTLLGWWPATLFKYLSEHAEIIQWTGFVSHNYNETSPSMGSGHYSRELDSRAASFNDCFGFDENGYVYEESYDPDTYVPRPDCYGVSEWYVTKHAARRHFFYGGPAGCSKKK
ncbi:protein neprosin-like [Carex rostrata]